MYSTIIDETETFVVCRIVRSGQEGDGTLAWSESSVFLLGFHPKRSMLATYLVSQSETTVKDSWWIVHDCILRDGSLVVKTYIA